MMKKIRVTSRYNGFLVAKENTGIRHVFPKVGTVIELTEDQIKNICYSEGGRTLIERYLLIDDKKILEDLGLLGEPEDTFSFEDMKDLLINGTSEQLADALEFGNDGTISLIRDAAVALPLTDNNKIQVISDKLNINLSNIIKVHATEEVVEPESRVRRTTSFVPNSKNHAPRGDNAVEERVINGKLYKVVKD